MGGYDFAYLNKPLVFTGVLKKGAVKRLKDTLEFWVNVTRENALKINSDAYQLIVRTRLMHSYARLKIKEKNKDWDYGNWGEPINTWDMVATYTGFSLVFMQGLKKLGIIISEEEEKGVFHLWKYIGYLLGIPADLMPENRQQATEQFYLWTATQAKGDEDSAHLAKALLDENLQSTILKYEFQRKNLRYLHICCNWYLLDAEINNRLLIPAVAVPHLFPSLIRKANILTQKIFKLSSEKKYSQLVKTGNKQQLKVLDDYLKHTPKDFHY
ncbi:oxygenase MpaB family protein [Chryseobacterium sp.]|uniref:oxygenase MpaB family protein n=1 Tax=Chryseobacterium sp. TaxID=1871047 RepID=UPI0039776593